MANINNVNVFQGGFKLFESGSKESSINWEDLQKEFESLRQSENTDVKDFAVEALSEIQKKDEGKFKEVLKNWVPKIGKFIVNTNGVLDIASKLGLMSQMGL